MATIELKRLNFLSLSAYDEDDNDDDAGLEVPDAGKVDEKEDFEKELGENMDDNEFKLDDEDLTEESEV